MSRNLSDKYQYFFNEISFDAPILGCFDNSQSLYRMLNPYSYNEELLQMKDELYQIIISNSQSILTNIQYNTFICMYIDKMTQAEAAKKLKCSQSTINKAMTWINKKLSQEIKKIPRAVYLLEQIREIQQEEIY